MAEFGTTTLTVYFLVEIINANDIPTACGQRNFSF
jgi:hypothetical protein